MTNNADPEGILAKHPLLDYRLRQAKWLAKNCRAASNCKNAASIGQGRDDALAVLLGVDPRVDEKLRDTR